MRPGAEGVERGSESDREDCSALGACGARFGLSAPDASSATRVGLAMPGLAMPSVVTQVERYTLVITIGGMPVRVNTSDADFLAMLERRYDGFAGSRANEVRGV